VKQLELEKNRLELVRDIEKLERAKSVMNSRGMGGH